MRARRHNAMRVVCTLYTYNLQALDTISASISVPAVSIVYGPARYPLLAASASALGPSTSIPPPAMSPVQMPKGGPKVSCVTPIVEPSLMTCVIPLVSVKKGRYPHSSDTLVVAGPNGFFVFAHEMGGIHA